MVMSLIQDKSVDVRLLILLPILISIILPIQTYLDAMKSFNERK